MQAVQSDPAAVKKSGRDKIERLRAETANFNASLDRHQRLIARMRRVTDGIVKTIAEDAARHRAPKANYGASGAASYRAKATPIAINRKV